MGITIFHDPHFLNPHDFNSLFSGTGALSLCISARPAQSMRRLVRTAAFPFLNLLHNLVISFLIQAVEK